MSSSEQMDDENPIDTPEPVMRSKFDWTDIAPSTAVIEMIAEESGRDPTTLEPLYASVDPEALDRLVRGNGVAQNERMLSVSLSFAGYTVAVRSNGIVELYGDG